MRKFYTSESVSEGHPDKLADFISDSLLDEFLRQEPSSRVAVETLVTTGMAVVAGEVKGLAHRTAEATADIGARLQALRASSLQTADGVRCLSESIGECRGHALAVSAAVDAQVRATGMISANAEGAASRTRETVDTVSSIRDFAGENERALAKVVDAARGVSDDGDAMARLVDGFVDALREVEGRSAAA